MKDSEICSLRSRASMVDNYENQIRNLRDEVDILSTRPTSYTALGLMYSYKHIYIYYTYDL